MTPGFSKPAQVVVGGQFCCHCGGGGQQTHLQVGLAAQPRQGSRIERGQGGRENLKGACILLSGSSVHECQYFGNLGCRIILAWQEIGWVNLDGPGNLSDSLA